MCLLYVCCNDMGMHMLSIGNATLDFTLKEWEEDQRPGGANQLLRIFEGRAHKPHASRKSTTTTAVTTTATTTTTTTTTTTATTATIATTRLRIY